MDAQLHLAVDSVAAFRSSGDGKHPSTVSVALLAELAGADAISYDLRSGDRSEGERDARLLRACLAGRLEVVVASGPDLMDLAFSLRPDRITLAPERRTSGGDAGGVDAHMLKDSLRRQVLPQMQAWRWACGLTPNWSNARHCIARRLMSWF